jgi:transaldolase
MNVSSSSPLARTVATTPTDFWNDSCDPGELTYAIANGATGATSNPPILLDVLRREPALWRERAIAIHAEHPAWSETELAWRIAEELVARGARLLEPIFEREAGRKGRQSFQLDPTHYGDADAMLDQAIHLETIAPNLNIKHPVTAAGLVAMEEATARGISVNGTVNFTVAGAIAVAEAVERGLRRREAAGGDTGAMSPVCAFMVGRLDDWMRVLCERDDIIVSPGVLDWAGVAAFKRAYTIYRERGYRTRLLAAAYRNHLHWSEFIGGDVAMTIPAVWQRRFNASAVEVRPRMDDPVDPAIIAELARIPDFERAYEADGLSPAELDAYGATVRTLRQFIKAYCDLQATIRDFVLPDPDRRQS